MTPALQDWLLAAFLLLCGLAFFIPALPLLAR
jgi:hypothetical protein